MATAIYLNRKRKETNINIGDVQKIVVEEIKNAIEVGNSSPFEETNSTPKLGSLIDGSSSSSPIEALTPSISS